MARSSGPDKAILVLPMPKMLIGVEDDDDHEITGTETPFFVSSLLDDRIHVFINCKIRKVPQISELKPDQ
jgi:hypothetical protein